MGSFPNTCSSAIRAQGLLNRNAQERKLEMPVGYLLLAVLLLVLVWKWPALRSNLYDWLIVRMTSEWYVI
jgi:hypothetical protein